MQKMTWQAAITQQLTELTQNKFITRNLYGTLAASIMRPLVHAVNNQELAALTTLGRVMSKMADDVSETSIDETMLIEKIPQWDQLSDDELAVILLENAEQDECWRLLLDHLLTEFDVVNMVQTLLTEAGRTSDHTWFTNAIETQSAALGSRIDIANSTNTAINSYNNSNINVGGNLVHSLLTVYLTNQVGNQNNTSTLPQLSADDYHTALIRYLNHILSTQHVLNLRGIRSYQPLSLELERMYVTLHALDTPTMRQPQERTKPLRHSFDEPPTLQYILAAHPRLVVLGDPGSGKTTFVSFLALSTARAIVNDDQTLVHERLGLTGDVPLPIVLPLREFGRYLRHLPQEKHMGPQPQLLLDYLNAYFAGWNLDLPDDFFTHHLASGRCLVLFDGLDEVADIAERSLVREQVEAFVLRYGEPSDSKLNATGNRFVVTCRVRGYEGQARLDSDFFTSTILPFTEDDIQQFTNTWSLAVECTTAQSGDPSIRQRADEAAEHLRTAIYANNKVKGLASNPLLLTVIALVHRYRGKLPERRSELYNECTEVLLGYWESGKQGEESKRLATYTGTMMEMDAGEKRAFLEPIAYALHESRVREWDQRQLLMALQTQFEERGQPPAIAKQMAEKFLMALVVRNGLVQEIEQGLFEFMHLSFQEYFAARKLADSEDFIEETLNRLDDSWWHEPILLQAAHLSESGRRRVSSLIEAILRAPTLNGIRSEIDRTILAGQCLIDVGQNKVEASVWRHVIERLKAAMRSDATLHQRTEAATTLGMLGDDRKGVGVRIAIEENRHIPDIDWVQIEPRVFIMGGDPHRDRQVRREEQPQFMCTLLTHAFHISRYPITVAQYQAFIDAGGYHQERYWTNEGWQWATDNNIIGPAKYQEVFTIPNHPQVGISWFEAIAFCRWFSEQTKQPIHLPSEAQWERTARHTTGRLYPWGDQGTVYQRCNVNNTGIGHPSAVGLFTNGNSDDGVADMAGNVWEWCGTQWRDNYYDYEVKVSDAVEGNVPRVVRGGSFDDPQSAARCTYRIWHTPHARLNNLGFRVVLAD
ncbi:MAG: SUMF1/EgtB/PvdO family nonheme iron enzyme [Chloroflexota bacterium]